MQQMSHAGTMYLYTDIISILMVICGFQQTLTHTEANFEYKRLLNRKDHCRVNQAVRYF